MKALSHSRIHSILSLHQQSGVTLQVSGLPLILRGEAPASEQARTKWEGHTKHFVGLEQNPVCRIHLVKEFMLTEQAIYSNSP